MCRDPTLQVYLKNKYFIPVFPNNQLKEGVHYLSFKICNILMQNDTIHLKILTREVSFKSSLFSEKFSSIISLGDDRLDIYSTTSTRMLYIMIFTYYFYL